MTHAGFIDVDTHIIEPPELFTLFGMSTLQDAFPKYGTHEGNVGWFYDDTFYGVSKAATQAGRPWGQSGLFVPSQSIPDGLDDPLARLEAMDRDGVAMALCYPSFMGLGGETMTRSKDKVVGLAAVMAYNRFLKEYWCWSSNSRFLRAVALPLWDVDMCGRMAKIAALEGAKAILFPQSPEQLGLPVLWDPHWDPLWHACETNELVVATHTLSDQAGQYMAMRATPFLALTLARMSGIATIASWLLTPVLDRHPNLRVMVGEAGVGWVPWFLDLAQTSCRLAKFEFGRMNTSPLEKAERCLGLPILGGESVTAGVLEALPSGLQQRLMFCTDYPHLDGSWPNSRAAFDALDVPEYMRAGAARDNAIDFFRIQKPFEIPHFRLTRRYSDGMLPDGKPVPVYEQ